MNMGIVKQVVGMPPLELAKFLATQSSACKRPTFIGESNSEAVIQLGSYFSVLSESEQGEFSLKVKSAISLLSRSLAKLSGDCELTYNDNELIIRDGNVGLQKLLAALQSEQSSTQHEHHSSSALENIASHLSGEKMVASVGIEPEAKRGLEDSVKSSEAGMICRDRAIGG
jgi:hypothetical protein